MTRISWLLLALLSGNAKLSPVINGATFVIQWAIHDNTRLYRSCVKNIVVSAGSPSERSNPVILYVMFETRDVLSVHKSHNGRGKEHLR
jgi:hypothetical protein